VRLKTEKMAKRKKLQKEKAAKGKSCRKKKLQKEKVPEIRKPGKITTGNKAIIQP
jgi:hypothetical protein